MRLKFFVHHPKIQAVPHRALVGLRLNSGCSLRACVNGKQIDIVVPLGAPHRGVGDVRNDRTAHNTKV